MHRILATIDTVNDALSQAADANPIFLATAEKKTAILALKRLESRLVELRLRVEADASDLAYAECSGDVSAVLVAAGLDDAKHAKGEVKLAAELARHERVRAALAAGDFTTAHASVIMQTLEDLPDDLDPEIRERAEVDLCQWAGEFSPPKLRNLAQRVLSTVDPEHGEEAEARMLARLEEEAAKKSTLSIRSRGDGTSQVFAILTDPVAARLTTVLESLAQPRKAALDADGRVRPRGRLMAEALESLLERVDPDTLPAHGGDATTMIVTTTLDSLRAELGLATMADGTVITAAEARRLACTASIIPAVLGGDSEILDLGRAKRLFSPGQRKELGIRDKHCRAEGCTVPATWFDAHHLKPWSRGGRTDLVDGILLCGHHHRRIHDPKCESIRMPNGDIRFRVRR